jgi:peptide/nickel transport system ATP-binding protein
MSAAPILQIDGMCVAFDHPRGRIRAVDDISLSLLPGERLGLAGESGSGKSTLALSILRMIKPPGHMEAGVVRFLGSSIGDLDEERMRALRLAGIALVPQGSMNSLNPVARIDRQISDVFVDHGFRLDDDQRERRIVDLLARVGLPANVARMYPHQLSGGMKQRACIAIAICLRPKVIIADEPTSALDVVVQRQVMATLARVQRELGAAVILIGHDMGLMAQFVDRLAIMYAGRLVEVAPIAEIISRPRHPYTRALIAALPSLHQRGALSGIPGLAPSLRDLPSGCAFHPRCSLAVERCRGERPALRETDGAAVACHLA